jgi:hypothetical protein
MRIKHPREALLAALITVALVYARTAVAECPVPRKIDENTRLVHECWIADINADFEAARVINDRCIEARDNARLELESARFQCAAEIDEIVGAMPPAAPKQDLWAWTLAGGLAVAAPVGLCSIGVECGPGYAPWIAAATSLGIVALVGWWID